MRRVLLDTDILSEVLKQKHLGVAEKARAYLAIHGRLTLSAVSVMEIIYGLRRVGRHDRADQVATSLVGNDVLDLDIEAGLLAGTVNAEWNVEVDRSVYRT